MAESNNIGKGMLMVGLSALALFFLPTVLALKSLKVEFGGLAGISLKNSKLTLKLYLNLINNSGTPLTFTKARIAVGFNEYYLGDVYVDDEVTVSAHSAGILPFEVVVPFEYLGEALWNSLVDGTLTENFTLQVGGYAKINNKQVKLKVRSFTQEDVKKLLS